MYVTGTDTQRGLCGSLLESMNPELLWRIAITEATTPFDAINLFEPIPWETGAVDLIQLKAGEIEDMQKEGTLPSGYLSCGGPNSEYGYQHLACSCIEWRLETQKGIVAEGRNEYASRVQVLEGLQEHMDMNGQPVPERGVFGVKYDTCVRAMRELSDPAEQMDVLLRLRRRKTTWSILHLVSKGVRNRLLEFDCHSRNSEGCDGSLQEKKDYPTACDNSSFGASPWSRGRRARGTVQEWAEMLRWDGQYQDWRHLGNSGARYEGDLDGGEICSVRLESGRICYPLPTSKGGCMALVLEQALELIQKHPILASRSDWFTPRDLTPELRRQITEVREGVRWVPFRQCQEWLNQMRLRVAVAGAEGLLSVQEWQDNPPNLPLPDQPGEWAPAGAYQMTVVFTQTGMGSAHVELMMRFPLQLHQGEYVPWHQDSGMLEVEQVFSRHWIGGQGTEASTMASPSSTGQPCSRAGKLYMPV
jgi:hypothetical protein